MSMSCWVMCVNLFGVYVWYIDSSFTEYWLKAATEHWTSADGHQLLQPSAAVLLTGCSKVTEWARLPCLYKVYIDRVYCLELLIWPATGNIQLNSKVHILRRLSRHWCDFCASAVCKMQVVVRYIVVQLQSSHWSFRWCFNTAEYVAVWGLFCMLCLAHASCDQDVYVHYALAFPGPHRFQFNADVRERDKFRTQITQI